MKAIILAAGVGRRLRPHTDYTPKPLLPIGGKSVIGQIVENLGVLNLQEIIVVLGNRGDEIKKYLKRFNYPISYVTQRSPLGTAHALSAASHKINGDVLVSAGDTIFPKGHYKALCAAFKKWDLDAALSLKVMNKKQMKESSTVKLGSGGRILKVIEKPAEDEMLSEIACGPMYLFKDVIKDYLTVEKSKRGEYEITDSIQAMIEGGRRVRGIVTKKWQHLSTEEDFIRLNPAP
ncbi:MAG: nucleotidyltransferase family protein [Candidatus Hydrothermarchaeaceae archaeon]